MNEFLNLYGTIETLHQVLWLGGTPYDAPAALGRFLSPDPVVQAPDDTQSFNRYSYCLNNPLRYTDPTGLFNPLPSQYRQKYLARDTYDGEMIYELVVIYGKPSYWQGCGTFAPNAPYVDNYVTTLYNRYASIQQPLSNNCGVPLGGGYGETGYSQNRKSAYLSIAIETTKELIKSNNATYAWVKDNIPVLKISNKGSNKIYGHTGHRVAGLARGLGVLGKALTFYSIATDISNIRNSNDICNQVDYGMDAFMNAIGLIDDPATLGVSIGWNLGGNKLFYMWREEVLLPQVKDGTAGLMIYQPSK